MDRNQIKRQICNSCMAVCDATFCKKSRDQKKEQREYLKERERIEKILEENKKLNQVQNKSTGDSPVLTSGRRIRFADPPETLESFYDTGSLTGEMPLRFKMRNGGDRRNAMGRSSTTRRKSLMKGILSVASGGEKPPLAELRSGKTLPAYLEEENEKYMFPECCNKPLPEPDDFYARKTYIVVNKQGTIFRFSKAESLFLFGEKSRTRTSAIKMFITPMFANFITFIIMCNCACMVLAEPPTWVEDYLEYVFTSIYIIEACFKIVARGFVLHKFSYLRDPWNWLDFIVIVSAIITEILKAVVSSAAFGQVGVLRAFRVLRALKTMSVVPGLRGIVKALLRSIRALKDAVVLTVFCVSVFALVGYQLFAGTLRQKCVRIPGSLEVAPEALFYTSHFNDHEYMEYVHTYLNQSQSRKYFPLYVTDIEKRDLECSRSMTISPSNGVTWSIPDVTLMSEILNSTKAFNCSKHVTFKTTTSSKSSLLRHADKLKFDSGDFSARWNCHVTNKTVTSSDVEQTLCDVVISAYAVDIKCLSNFLYKNNQGDDDVTTPYFLLNSTSDDVTEHGLKLANNGLGCNNDSDYLDGLVEFGFNHVRNWQFRSQVVVFDILTLTEEISDEVANSTFLYYSELTKDEMTSPEYITWLESDVNHCKSEPTTGLYYYVNSSNRPIPEPLYCAIGSTNVCPIGFDCQEAGENPDFGYTSFDHFFLAFLTSFRLVALDAWSRLYYLTLHTVGQTYSIFYILVVLLGSYYLVNLILAVVYMAYEEQQAVVEEEEEEAREREEEKRVLKGVSSLVDEESNHSDTPSDVELGGMRLITTSLASHDECPTSPFIRKRRFMTSQSNINEEEGEEERRSERIIEEECATMSDGNFRSSQRRKKRRNKKKKMAPSSSDKENRVFSDRNNSDVPIPVVKLVVTSAVDESGFPSPRISRSRNSEFHLSVGEAWRRPLATSSDDEGRREKPQPFSQGNLPIIIPLRSLSESSSFSEENIPNKRVVKVDMNYLHVDDKSSSLPLLFSSQNPSLSSRNSSLSSQDISFRNPSLSSRDQSPAARNRASAPGRPEVDAASSSKDPTLRSQRGSEDSKKGILLPLRRSRTSKESSWSPGGSGDSKSSRILGEAPGVKVDGSPRVSLKSSESQRSSRSSRGNSTSAKETDGWESGDEEEIAISERRSGKKKRRRTKSRRSNQSPECSEKETLLPTVTSHDSNLTYDVVDDDVIRNFSSENQNRDNDYERVTHLESINFLGEDLHSHQRVTRRKLKDSSFYSSYLKLSRSFVNTFGRWKCCPPWWAKFQKLLRKIVLNPFTDLLITLCIALNTFFMSLERYPMDDDFSSMLDHANLFFTVIFTVEMLTKIFGLTPYTYFKERWNMFDAVIVFFSVLEVLFDSTQGFSVLRAFRLMRILKLAKQWPTLNKLLRIIGKTLSKLWHLTLVFLLVLFIFAVVGMQLLRKYYLKHYQENQPRWNFVDFKHSFMVVFRIQCGEWVENMFNCLHVAEPGICIPLFVLVYIIGNLVILNLFLALLLNSFSGDILQQTSAGNNSITEAFRHLVTWFRQKRDSLKELDINSYCCRLLKLGVRASPIKIMENIPQNEQVGLKEVFHILPQNGKPDENDPMLEQAKTNGNGMSTYDHVKNDVIKTDHRKQYHNHDLHERSRDRIYGSSLVLSNGNHRNNDDNKSINHSMRSRTHSRVSTVSALDGRSTSRLSACGKRRKTTAVARERFRGIGEDAKYRRKSLSFTSDEKGSVKGESLDIETVEEEVLSPFCCCGDSKVKEEGRWFKIRKLTFKVAKHSYFDNFVIFCILLSSVTLALEDIHIHKKPTMKKIVESVDIFCCIFFTIEMLIKWIGFGLKKYFTDAWCILDFLIVMVSIFNLSLSAVTQTDLRALRVLRTFRALRPLRALSRFEGMKIVVDALVRAVPSIGHVFLVCIIFWLIFSILGVNLFGGSFGRCVSLTTGDILPSAYASNSSIIQDCSLENALLLRYLRGELDPKDVDPAFILPRVAGKKECEECAKLLNTTLINWQTPSINFDTVFGGYLALLQVATFNGWLEIMEATIDITGVEMQPSYEASFYYYIYYCVFIVFGAFFSLNLFIGVIIDNFNQQKLKSKGGEDGVFLTEEQKRYYNAMKRMASKTPKKPIPRPNNVFANKVYDVVTSRKFEITVMLLIMLNLVVMAIEHRGMTPDMSEVLQYSNLGFICVFVVEAILKLIGLRWYYFTVTWNVFDLLVVVISLIATGLHDLMEKYFVQPTIFRIIRLFRVTRILRLIREAKGIRTLLFALMMSLPALFNIGSLLFLLMFIYAIIGMSQFPYVQKVAGIDNLLNFETFPNAFLVLFQVSTSEGWDKFIDPVLRDTPPYCDTAPSDGSPSNCGNSTIGVIYFVTYVMITFLIVVNMYIAIILENFEVATRESGEPLTADDFEQFFEVWQRYDDRLSQYVTYEQLQHLLHHLDFPLRVPMPNRAFIAHAHMRITLDGRIHCLEVIISLIKKVLGDSPELNNLKEAMLQNFMLQCKSKETEEAKETMDAEEFTMKWEAAKCIQKAYKNYKLNQQRAYKGEFSDESDEELEVFSSADENENDSVNGLPV